MRIEGKRLKRKRLIQGGRYVVEVEVEAVVPMDDPSEPCYESETVRLCREIAERAEQGDVDWLMKHGKVFRLLEAA